MSMSTHVYGIIPPDAKWRKMKAVWDACDKAGIDPPADVSKFFDGEEPDELGVVIDLEQYTTEDSSFEAQDRFEIKLADLPEHIKIIRFVNSY